MNKTFGQYIKGAREQMGLEQKDVYGPKQGQSYLSEIEAGRKNPSTRKTIIKIAGLLGLPKDDYFINWLWCYSLLNVDPYEYFRKRPSDKQIRENNHYLEGGEVNLSPNTTEEEVLHLMGRPDKRIRLLSLSKWIYEKEGIHLVFADGRVKDIMFK